VLPHWGKRHIQDIARRDVIELLDGIVDRGVGTTANRVLAAVRKLFNWAIERDVIAFNPCLGIKAPSPETSRERVLSDEEIVWLWQALDQQSYPFGPLGKLLLLTGQRRDEVAGMTAGEINVDEGVWTIPRARAKNDQEHHVPLSDAVLAVLAAAPRIAGEAGYLFTTNGRTAVSGFSKAKASVDDKMLAAGRKAALDAGKDPDAITVPPWTWHDLRRTAASGMARLGQPVHVVEAVLNHRSGTIRGIAKVYNRYSHAEEKRRALESWGRYLGEALSDRKSNVISMHKR